MREFSKILRRFLVPYKRFVVLTILFNVLAALLNIVSFMAIIPILEILFEQEKAQQSVSLMALADGSMSDVLTNNMNYYVRQLIEATSATTTLLVVGMVLAVMTMLKSWVTSFAYGVSPQPAQAPENSR